MISLNVRYDRCKCAVLRKSDGGWNAVVVLVVTNLRVYLVTERVKVLLDGHDVTGCLVNSLPHDTVRLQTVDDETLNTSVSRPHSRPCQAALASCTWRERSRQSPSLSFLEGLAMGGSAGVQKSEYLLTLLRSVNSISLWGRHTCTAADNGWYAHTLPYSPQSHALSLAHPARVSNQVHQQQQVRLPRQAGRNKTPQVNSHLAGALRGCQ